jgi:hypothetical protein
VPVLKASVSSDIKERFQAAARQRTLSESEFLRRAILTAMGEDTGRAQPIESDAGKTGSARLTVRMPQFMIDAATHRAAGKGMAVSRWIAALVQSNLLQQPVLTDCELEALGASSRELAAIGRNINQIAKVLNAAPHETDRLRHDTLAELLRSIADNRSAIRALTRASLNSWEAESAHGID